MASSEDEQASQPGEQNEALMLAALDAIGAALNEQGVTLDEWIEGAREERAALLETVAKRDR